MLCRYFVSLVHFYCYFVLVSRFHYLPPPCKVDIETKMQWNRNNISAPAASVVVHGIINLHWVAICVTSMEMVLDLGDPTHITNRDLTQNLTRAWRLQYRHSRCLCKVCVFGIHVLLSTQGRHLADYGPHPYNRAWAEVNTIGAFFIAYKVIVFLCQSPSSDLRGFFNEILMQLSKVLHLSNYLRYCNTFSRKLWPTLTLLNVRALGV